MMACMSRQCQILGTHASMGNKVSHSQHKTRRTFGANLQRKRYWVPSLNRFVTLTVSARGIKTISHIGIDKAVAQAQERGLLKL